MELLFDCTGLGAERSIPPDLRRPGCLHRGLQGVHMGSSSQPGASACSAWHDSSMTTETTSTVRFDRVERAQAAGRTSGRCSIRHEPDEVDTEVGMGGPSPLEPPTFRPTSCACAAECLSSRRPTISAYRQLARPSEFNCPSLHRTHGGSLAGPCPSGVPSQSARRYHSLVEVGRSSHWLRRSWRARRR